MIFTKMQGTGNDFIVVEDLDSEYECREGETAKILCDRHFGIGADGVLYVRKSEKSDIKMVIINSDGSYAAMCGNGIRCFAKYVWEKNLVNTRERKVNEINIETGDGIKTAYLKVDDDKVTEVCIYMGVANYEPSKVPVNNDSEIVNMEILANNKTYKITSMLLGVTHTMIFGDLDSFHTSEGKEIEFLNIFPENTNVNFCEIIDRTNVRVKTWERGAGETLACGTGSCASVVASNRLGLTDKKVTVMVPGGKIVVEVMEDGVYMTGPAETVFKGELQI